jgi:Na+/proline symporter
MAAIPVSLLLWGMTSADGGTGIPKWQLITSIILIGAVGVAYTVAGGVRAVIWTDTAQIIIVIGAALLSIFLLLHSIPASLGEILATLNNQGKLRIIDTSFNATSEFTIWTAIIGAAFLSTAAYGTDHDLAQRVLTAKSPLRGSLSLIYSQCLGMLVVGMFLILGLLLYIFYNRPDIMGSAAPKDAVSSSYAVYPQFLLRHMPSGLAGLAMAGMFAAAQGSLDSAINAMASSAVADLYWPLRRRLGKPVDSSSKAGRAGVLLVGAALILFAVVSAWVYNEKTQTLIPFALGVMSFAYTGMLGVFLTALLTRRGNTASVLAALGTGLVVTTLLQDGILAWWTAAIFGSPLRLCFYWWMPIGTVCSFVVCVLGKPRPTPDQWQTAFPVIPCKACSSAPPSSSTVTTR